jgi:hypothetical protein
VGATGTFDATVLGALNLIIARLHNLPRSTHGIANHRISLFVAGARVRLAEYSLEARPSNTAMLPWTVRIDGAHDTGPFDGVTIAIPTVGIFRARLTDGNEEVGGHCNVLKIHPRNR